MLVLHEQTGELGGVALHMASTWWLLVALAVERPWWQQVGQFSPLHVKLRKCYCHFVRAPFLVLKAV